MPSLHRRSLLLSVSLLLACSGCSELFGGESVATVRMFATHAGTPTDDGFPNYGDSITTRVFTNDTGWQLSLAEVFVTTAEVRIVECAADLGDAIEMFWGACPEDFVGANDRESVALGAVTIADGDYCRVDVTYGPYVPSAQSEEHINPDNPMIEGNTILIVGTARRGEGATLEEVPFQIVSDATVTARVDISELDDGRPLKLEDEDFPSDLTILKTYDTFFAGIDFSVATPAELEAAVLAALERDTVIYPGSEI